MLAWAAVTWQWEDPFTALVTWNEQRRLGDSYEAKAGAASEGIAEAWRVAKRDGVGAERRRAALRTFLRTESIAYRRTLRPGEALGRLRIPKLDLNVVAVEGTDAASLKKGPGRHPSTGVPGEGKLVYVAGHRTTYGAPFSRIDRLKRGDTLSLELPYATFVYAVTGRRIVPADYLEALRFRGREEIALQACWPRFFASHRIIVYAKPVAVTVSEHDVVSLALSP